MTSTHPIDELATIARTFGTSAAARKRLLLEDIGRDSRDAARRLVRLHQTLSFMCAYPDNPGVHGAARALNLGLRERVVRLAGRNGGTASLANSGLPATCNSYPYAYGVLQRLTTRFPGALEIAWEDVSEIPPITDAINLTVTPGESRGLEDEYQDLPDWLSENSTRDAQTDLEVLLALFRRSPLTPRQQAHVFESLALPVRFHLRERGSAACEATWMPTLVCYQRAPIRTTRFPLRPRIRRPLRPHRRLSEAEGREWLDRALIALCGRNLEIHPLIYANPADVTLVDGERGLQLILAGMQPDFRQALESDFFFLIAKNGVPIAYGPASVFAGCCEMGINLFPEFRGGEIRLVYAQLMNALYHLAGVRYFFVTSYGMGENNLDALRSGAFWFYRKLGFRATEPDVEALARDEEAIMRSRPGYRCSIATLRALSHTDVFLDLSRQSCRPLNFESLGRAVSAHINTRYNGDRARAVRACQRQLVSLLNIDVTSWSAAERAALGRLAPILILLPDIQSWRLRDKRALAATIRARGAVVEFDYVRRLERVPNLVDALHQVAVRETGPHGS